jgi:DNA invertase Pin-like site-specific DNA recombinase
MERPALKRLIAEIEAGQIDVVVAFAQFEREVTGERIRDKIAASKKKGMWMGGMPLLGYDVRNRKLVINDAEARIVVDIYNRATFVGGPSMPYRTASFMDTLTC